MNTHKPLDPKRARLTAAALARELKLAEETTDPDERTAALMMAHVRCKRLAEYLTATLAPSTKGAQS
jgi:hypothetical protein